MNILISQRDLQNGVARLAQRISYEYRDMPLMLIGILQDSIVLLGDLMRQLEIPAQVRIVQPTFLHQGPNRPSHLCVDQMTAEAVQNHHVLIVDDVFDTGLTLLETMCQVDESCPLSVKSAVLLRKRGRQQTAAGPDYVAFDIPDKTVVGYGLDYHGHFRCLPHIAALEPHEMHGFINRVVSFVGHDAA